MELAAPPTRRSTHAPTRRSRLRASAQRSSMVCVCPIESSRQCFTATMYPPWAAAVKMYAERCVLARLGGTAAPHGHPLVGVIPGRTSRCGPRRSGHATGSYRRRRRRRWRWLRGLRRRRRLRGLRRPRRVGLKPFHGDSVPTTNRDATPLFVYDGPGCFYPFCHPVRNGRDHTKRFVQGAVGGLVASHPTLPGNVSMRLFHFRGVSASSGSRGALRFLFIGWHVPCGSSSRISF